MVYNLQYIPEPFYSKQNMDAKSHLVFDMFSSMLRTCNNTGSVVTTEE